MARENGKGRDREGEEGPLPRADWPDDPSGLLGGFFDVMYPLAKLYVEGDEEQRDRIITGLKQLASQQGK